MTLKEMKEQAKKAYDAKHANDEIDQSMYNTVGNAGVTHENVWENNITQEKTKEEIMKERELAQTIKMSERMKRNTEDN